MARFLLGPMVADARGKQGGMVFSRNAAGHYGRAKVSPVQPKSSAQMAVRAHAAYIALYWRDVMTPTLRTPWETYAKSTPLTDRFGAKVCISGLAMFIRYNSHIRRSGIAILTAAPTIGGEAPMPKPTVTGDTTLGILVTAMLPVVASGDIISIAVNAAPMSQARNYFSGPWRYVLNFTFASTPPVEIIAPAGVAIGQRWFLRFRMFATNGMVGPTWQAPVDILA